MKLLRFIRVLAALASLRSIEVGDRKFSALVQPAESR